MVDFGGLIDRLRGNSGATDDNTSPPPPAATFDKALSDAQLGSPGGPGGGNAAGDTTLTAFAAGSTGAASASGSKEAGREAGEGVKPWLDRLLPGNDWLHGTFNVNDDLARHADDPAWQGGYLEGLGTEHLARLIDRATEPDTYLGATLGDDPEAYFDEIRGAVETAYENGELTDAELQDLIGEIAEQNGGEIPPHVADFFANSSSPELKAAFVEQSLELWRQGGNNASTYAAAAAYVLDNSSSRTAAAKLVELEDSGELHDFIQDAMSEAETVASTFALSADNAGESIEYDGVTGLIEKITRREYSGAQLTPLPADADDLERVSNTIFDAANDGLEGSGYYQNSTEFKDAFSTLFTSHFDHLIGTALDGQDNGALKAEFASDLETFSRYVVFGHPPGDRQAFAQSFLADQIDELITLAEGGGIDDTVDVGGTSITRADAADVAGQLLGHAFDGLSFAVADAEARNAELKAAQDFILDIAFAYVPGPNIDDVLKPIYGAVEGEGKDAIRNFLAGDGVTIDAGGFDQLKDQIAANIGNGSASDDPGELRDQFGDGFTLARDTAIPTS